MSDDFKHFAGWAAVVLGVFYLFAMVLIPLFEGNGEWAYLQAVWMDWQGLNGAVIALFGASLAIYAGGQQLEYHKNKDKEELARKLEGAKSRLPEVLSVITETLTNASQILIALFSDKSGNLQDYVEINSLEQLPKIEIDNHHSEIIQSIIELSENSESSMLVDFLKNFQIVRSRTSGCDSSSSGGGTRSMSIDAARKFENLITLYAYLDRLWPIARGGSERETGHLSKDEMVTAMRNLVSSNSPNPSVEDRIFYLARLDTYPSGDEEALELAQEA